MKKSLILLLLALSLLLSGCVLLPEPPTESTAAAPPEGILSVHYLDVGQADCALVSCGGEHMIIDGGNKEDGSLVVSFLQQQGVEELSALVCTHAHEDHVGGLPSVLAVYPTDAVYAPTRAYDSGVFDDFVFYTDQQGLTITIPAPGDSFLLGDATVTVLGPTQSYAETNNTSIVLRISHGENTFLFTGDMELTAENDMLEYWQDHPDLLEADVLKVGHHGSNTSTGYRFLYEVKPKYAVIPVGRDNPYGLPDEVPLSRLEQAGVSIFRTDRLGTVTAVSDGSEILFTWSVQAASPASGKSVEDMVFIGNLKSRRFHAPGCASLPTKKNQVRFEAYDDAISAGYIPCKSCMK